MPYELKTINEAIRSDVKGFLEECDADYQKKIDSAAEQIIANIKKSPLVLLSGPSGSGKTTSALKITQALDKRGVTTHTVSMDNYFRTLSPASTPRTPEGDYDLESPLCLDMDLLNEHIDALEEGREILIPRYDFCRRMRDTSQCTPLKLGADEVAVFEGIHALNDDIAGVHPEATKLYLSARSNIMDGDRLAFKGTWIRLTRRAVRDLNFRGSDVMETLSGWHNVRRGEKLYISPFKYRANIIFDTAIPYEVSVLKSYALPLFEAVPLKNPRRSELLDMIEAFNEFESIDPDLVAVDSLIREFIGGGCYEY